MIMITTAPAPRIVYIVQGTLRDSFDVAFNCPDDCFPWHHPETRIYRNITRASLARLNHLVYLPQPGVTISAHIVPYINLWISFPPKGK